MPCPKARSYEIRLEGSRRPERVVVDGQEVSDWTYDSATLATVIPVPARDKRRSLTVTAVAAGGISALGEARNRRDPRRRRAACWASALPETADDAGSARRGSAQRRLRPRRRHRPAGRPFRPRRRVQHPGGSRAAVGPGHRRRANSPRRPLRPRPDLDAVRRRGRAAADRPRRRGDRGA